MADSPEIEASSGRSPVAANGDPGAWAVAESLYRLAADDVSPVVLRSDELAAIHEAQIASDQREATRERIPVSEARRRRSAREEARLDEFLAVDPTPACARCGNERPGLDEARLRAVAPSVADQVLREHAARPCSACQAHDQNSREQGRSATEAEDFLTFCRSATKQRRVKKLSRPAYVREAEAAAQAAEAEAEAQRADRRRLGVMPPGIPPLSPPIVLPCRNLLPGQRPTEGTTLHFYERGTAIRFASGNVMPGFPWHKIRSISVEPPENVKQRVTLPRLAAGGVFALGFKKTFERCFVVITLTSGQEDIYEIPGHSLMQTRADLGPALAWLSLYGEAVRADASYDY